MVTLMKLETGTKTSHGGSKLPSCTNRTARKVPSCTLTRYYPCLSIKGCLKFNKDFFYLRPPEICSKNTFVSLIYIYL